MSAAPSDAEQRLAFFRRLQGLADRIAAAHDVDEIMLEMSGELCELLGADRFTLYALADDGASLVSKLKTGLASFKQLKLPVSAQSIAGYAALSRQAVNLADVYDEAELKRHDPDLCFQQGVDRRTGYRTEQMLVAPVLAGDRLLGVLQLINNTHGGPFSATIVEGVGYLCDAIAAAFGRDQAPRRDRARFAALIPEAVLPKAQMDNALRSAAARGIDIEDVLLDEAGVRVGLVGRALAEFYGVPYFTYQSERRRPARLLDAFNREFVAEQGWMPLEEGRNGLFVLAVDPDRAKASGAFSRVFPAATPVWCVTTRREFGRMVEQFFGTAAVNPPEPAPAPALAAMATTADTAATLVNQAVAPLVENALRQGIRELHVTTEPQADGTIRFTVTGTFKP